MYQELIMMIALVVVLLIGNFWLLKRNQQSFKHKHKPSKPVSSAEKNKMTPAQNEPTDKPNL